MAEPMWQRWRASSWSRSDLAGASQPHDDQGVPCGKYWLGWPPYITGDRSDVGHPDRVLRKRFKTPEAARAYVDKTWPLGVQPDCSFISPSC